MNFHHIGIATHKIDDFIEKNELLKIYNLGESFVDVNLGVSGRFLESDSAPRLEILENMEDSKILNPWLQSGSPIYHMAFTLDSDEDKLRSELEIKTRTYSSHFKKDVCFHYQSGRFLLEYIHE